MTIRTTQRCRTGRATSSSAGPPWSSVARPPWPTIPSERSDAPGTGSSSSRRVRCAWSTEDPLYVAYHDEEWGVPVRDERRLFEFLILEGAQAGLSWLTVLRKTAPAYGPFLEDGVSPVPLFCLVGVLLWLLWRSPGGTGRVTRRGNGSASTTAATEGKPPGASPP